MIQLRLLGTVGLHTAAGAVTGRAAQKRRLALLSLLAAAPDRTLTRDKLIGLLWPDSEPEQARHLLSVALYELRKALGEDALVSRGDDVQLGPGVQTDLDELAAAFAAGDAERAIAVLRGPLLDGFYLSDSVEFEQWLDVERERLAQRCAAGLEALAQQKSEAGDALGAVAVWRRRAALDPGNGRVALSLMRALEAAGDRAGALRHSRVHTTLLREEFGAAPDPELVEYAERLKTDPAPRSGWRLPVLRRAPLPETVGMAAVAEDAATESRTRAGTAPAGRSSRFHRLRTRMRGLQALTIAAILLSLAGILTVFLDRADRGPRAGAEEPVSVAVLPFRDLGAESDSRFGDGLSIEIIQALTRAGLRVAPPGSAFQFRGDVNARAVGRQLNVRHLLEGTYERAGTDLQVTAHLVSVPANRLIWSDRYRVPWAHEERLNLQEEIARAVVAALRVQLAPGEAERPLVRSTSDERASREYTEGMAVLHRRTVPDLGTALQHFERAVAYDSSFARAHAAIAEVYTLLGAYDYGVLPPREAFPNARRAAQRALELDPLVAEAHAALGQVYFNFEWDRAAAEGAYREAMRLNRGFGTAWQWYGLVLSTLGRHEEAIETTRHARELDPTSLVLRAALGRSYYYGRDQARAIAEFENALAVDSMFITAHFGIGLSLVVSGRAAEAVAHYEAARRLPGGNAPVLSGLLGHAYGLAGRSTEARAELHRLEAAAQRGYVPAEYRVLVHLGLGEHEAALDALEEAFRNRSGGIVYLGVDPILDPLRGHPRFRSLTRRAGL